MTKLSKKLIDAVGPKSAAERHRASLASLDAEQAKLLAALAAAEAELEERTGLAEDTSGLPEKIVAVQAKLSALSLRRAPLGRHISEADAAEAARLEAERRARWTRTLEEKRQEAQRVRVAAVGAARDVLSAIARLDVLEREAERLGARLGVHALLSDASSDAIAADAAALFLDGLPEGVDPFAPHVVLTLSAPRSARPIEEPAP